MLAQFGRHDPVDALVWHPGVVEQFAPANLQRVEHVEVVGFH